ncbi:peptidase S8/S53 domain-containing protein [Podospora aff. communis PSN243]|uniref:Peptidase S8/S53 domain-containing protein n=1 Tax=Podospora aff. communis PSN243 TaxID=3040156 RepID=A0AAV9H4T3_9PEZI|nr:peptidase S8/S53 domain-containing protein [Podospora aff. communis PSN243]
MPVQTSLLPILLAIAAVISLVETHLWRPEGHVQYSSRSIPTRFIIQYHDGTDAAIRHEHESQTHAYARSVGGYQGVMRNFQIGRFSAYLGDLGPGHVEELRKSPIIKAIHPDAEIYLHAHYPNHSHQNPPPVLPAATAQPNILSTFAANWGLTRLSHRDPHRPNTSTNGPTLPETGPPRASWGKNFVNDINDDQMGHGTHVAAIIGGRTFGIARNTRLVALKVFGKQGSGASASNVIAALDWACKDTARRSAQSRSVINLSLGISTLHALDDAVAAAIQNCSITITTAAGNNNRPASEYSPAGVPSAITVASIGLNDTRSSFSNFGPAVDVFAPGEGILSAYPGKSGNETATLSGTSMAAPFVAGLAAYVMGLYGPMGPREMQRVIREWATEGRVRDARGSPNRIAFNGNRDELDWK